MHPLIKHTLSFYFLSFAYYNTFLNFNDADVEIAPFFMRSLQSSTILFSISIARILRSKNDEEAAVFASIFSGITAFVMSVVAFSLDDSFLRDAEALNFIRLIVPLVSKSFVLGAVFTESKKNIDAFTPLVTSMFNGGTPHTE